MSFPGEVVKIFTCTQMGSQDYSIQGKKNDRFLGLLFGKNEDSHNLVILLNRYLDHNKSQILCFQDAGPWTCFSQYEVALGICGPLQNSDHGALPS